MMNTNEIVVSDDENDDSSTAERKTKKPRGLDQIITSESDLKQIVDFYNSPKPRKDHVDISWSFRISALELKKLAFVIQAREILEFELPLDDEHDMKLYKNINMIYPNDDITLPMFEDINFTYCNKSIDFNVISRPQAKIEVGVNKPLKPGRSTLLYLLYTLCYITSTKTGRIFFD